MAGYYNKNHLFGISHSRIARYEILWKIIQERLEKMENVKLRQWQKMLTFLKN